MTPGLIRYINATFVSGGQLAHASVNRAVIKGDLPKVSSCKCVDCGADASCYDHRDYSLPLHVEPVCRSCNSKRGKASPKIWETFQEFMSYMTKSKMIRFYIAVHGFDVDLHAAPSIKSNAQKAAA